MRTLAPAWASARTRGATSDRPSMPASTTVVVRGIWVSIMSVKSRMPASVMVETRSMFKMRKSGRSSARDRRRVT